ncbi:MAG TPA: acyl-CoA dehydrogenase family protein [Candidatus Dormibacteraeota bacterium]|nr:acyl-CoA dehydrogenase family protein [Candidatus Dormibacteraeota bacterium]
MTLFQEPHHAFRTDVRRYVEENLAPHADEWERDCEFPATLFPDLGAAGLLGLTQPARYGGRELDFGYAVVLAEELPRCRMGGVTLSVLAQTSFFSPLLNRYGSEQQKAEFLAPAIRGEKVGALASTEPAGGSDIRGGVQCTAVDDGDFWVVSGEKMYITNGPIADFVVALVRTRPDGGANGLSLLLIPTDTPGFSVRETLRKLGLHTSPTGWLAFDRCRVPKAFTIGKPHLGYHYHIHNLLEERLIGGASSLAMADLVLQDTIAYLRQRMVYGQRLTALQTIRHKIAEMSAEVEMARAFVHAVCETFRDGHVDAKRICMIKYQVIDIVQRVVERCIQLFGANGFMEANWVTRAYRDVRVLSLGGGTSEVMKDLVATYLRL